ncbi:glycosyltransferase family protein [Pontibacter arcticus]|uniref:Glycosyltransferase n=1 Tax=Pontibacter arcticus TaxID=2080288 RepID=A0A364RCB7_9BACT|nr:glycosyltransferase [Pontibacter arcticus]RAU81988.1 glycosyltransferase [Pontibacter arcticus]
MSEKRILLASLLKPVTDTRMFEKIGLSLSQLPGTEVHICGFHTDFIPENSAVFFHPVFRFRRLSFGRITAQQQFYRLLRQLKPDLIIVCTHELLLPAALYKRKYSCKLVYDVQENYALNLKAQQNYPPVLKSILAFGVRSMEKLLAKSIDHYFLAERSYADELPFLKPNNYTILENKYKAVYTLQQRQLPVSLRNTPLQLLYAGTIAAEYGIFEAIIWAEKFYQQQPDITLTIIGYCAKATTWQRVLQATKNKPYIKLIGGSEPVPHQLILAQIQQCNLGLLPYQPNESTFRCIPTKLFEYAAHGLPILIQENPFWNQLVKQYKAGISIDFATAGAAGVLNQLQQQLFYQYGIPDDVFWKSEEQKLVPLISNLIN